MIGSAYIWECIDCVYSIVSVCWLLYSTCGNMHAKNRSEEEENDRRTKRQNRTQQFTVPQTAGRSFSFTKDGFWEEAMFQWSNDRKSHPFFA